MTNAVPLVLLHAFPLDSRMWDDVLTRLDGVPVIRFDAPGFGGAPVGPVGLDRFAADVVAEIRARGFDRAVVAGLSMGGYVAMAIADLDPGLLAGLGLLSTKAGADPEPARRNRLAMVEAVERGDDGVALALLDGLLGASTGEHAPDVVGRVRSWLSEAPAEGIAWAQRSMAARPDRLDALAALPPTLPALVLRGTEDALMSAADAAAMAQALDAPVTEVDGAGHLVAVEQPARVASALRELHARAIA